MRKIILCLAALLIGVAIPVAITVYFNGALYSLYGQTLDYRDLQLALRVALSAGVLLSVTFWHMVVNRVWKVSSVRVSWGAAIVLALMYGQWVAPTFACLCSTGAMIFGTITTFLGVLILRFLLALVTKDSPIGMLFYIPLMFGVPPYINHVVRSLTNQW